MKGGVVLVVVEESLQLHTKLSGTTCWIDDVIYLLLTSKITSERASRNPRLKDTLPGVIQTRSEVVIEEHKKGFGVNPELLATLK